MVSARRILLLVLVLAPLTALVDAQRPASDWTQWRGPNRDGAIAGFTAPAVWPKALTQRWKAEVGTGYATPLVVGNRVYMFSRLGDNETMTAIDADSGKVVWQAGYPAAYDMNPATKAHGPGPKSTPVFFNGRLYSIGMTGTVTAWDAASGKQVWQKPGDPKNVPTFTTHAFSPVVDRGIVIFHLGGHNNGVITGFDAASGDVKWTWAGDGPGYGSPVVADIGGTRQAITITQGKVVSLDTATGALLWERPFVSNNNTNSVTPVVDGQTVIVSGNGGPTVAFAVANKGAQWATDTLWENADIPARFNDPVIAGTLLFGMAQRNSGQYFGVDVKSGKTLWVSEPRQGAKAALQRSGELVFSLENDGELVVARPSMTAFEPVKRYKVAETETWSQPAISGNRIFVKDVSSLTLWTIN
jgi:outer membrane protein assembly factor BamB